MKAIIMAAGKGTRISRYLSGNPKCTVKLNKKFLIEYTVDLLKEKGINDISIVLGYNPTPIKEILKDKGVKFFYNPFYDVTNSIASLWFTKELLVEDDSVLLMNGDVFMEPKLLDYILGLNSSPLLLADSTRTIDADYRFKYEDKILIKYGKDLSVEDTTGEYVGIGMISKEHVGLFKSNLEKMINNQEHSFWWENILYHNMDSLKVNVEDVKPFFWAEVDYIEDYKRIKDFIEIDNDDRY